MPGMQRCRLNEDMLVFAALTCSWEMQSARSPFSPRHKAPAFAFAQAPPFSSNGQGDEGDEGHEGHEGHEEGEGPGGAEADEEGHEEGHEGHEEGMKQGRVEE